MPPFIRYINAKLRFRASSCASGGAWSCIWSCCRSSCGSIGEWGGSASPFWRASSWYGKICGKAEKKKKESECDFDLRKAIVQGRAYGVALSHTLSCEWMHIARAPFLSTIAWVYRRAMDKEKQPQETSTSKWKTSFQSTHLIPTTPSQKQNKKKKNSPFWINDRIYILCRIWIARQHVKEKPARASLDKREKSSRSRPPQSPSRGERTHPIQNNNISRVRINTRWWHWERERERERGGG